MDILILTGKFGMGHWSAALSLRETLERDGHQARVVDFFDYALPDVAPALYGGFKLLVTYGGGLYNLYHRMTRNMESDASRQLVRPLGGLLAAARPDLVISTHPVCSAAMARFKQEHPCALPLVTCVTDVTCHSEWIHAGTDCYLVPSATVRDGLEAKGVEAERVVVTGIPVRAQFVPSGQDGRKGPRELLIMGGGLGLMPRKDAFYAALDALPGVHTTILTGKNRGLYERLAGRFEHIEAAPFTDKVYEYMGRADLMLSKPGGVTAFEAIAAGLPMLAWEPFLEQERENARFLVEHGMARIVPKEEHDCLAAIRTTIYDDALLVRMRERMAEMERTLSRQAVNLVVERLICREASA